MSEKVWYFWIVLFKTPPSFSFVFPNTAGWLRAYQIIMLRQSFLHFDYQGRRKQNRLWVGVNKNLAKYYKFTRYGPSGGLRNVQSVQMYRALHFKGALHLSCRA